MGRPGLSSGSDTTMLLRGRRRSRRSKRAQQSLRPCLDWDGGSIRLGGGGARPVGGAERVREDTAMHDGRWRHRTLKAEASQNRDRGQFADPCSGPLSALS